MTMKKWIVGIVGGILIATLTLVPDYDQENARDVCYIQTPGASMFGEGQVVAVKPAESNWSEIEQGRTPCPNGARMVVATLELTEALGNSLTANPTAYVVDVITAPTNVIYEGE